MAKMVKIDQKWQSELLFNTSEDEKNAAPVNEPHFF
jgi:hypothetical protein